MASDPRSIATIDAAVVCAAADPQPGCAAWCAARDVALVLADWTVTVRDPEGQKHVDRGTATQVMKQQADGSWRLKISNPLGLA